MTGGWGHNQISHWSWMNKETDRLDRFSEIQHTSKFLASQKWANMNSTSLKGEGLLKNSFPERELTDIIALLMLYQKLQHPQFSITDQKYLGKNSRKFHEVKL